VAGVTAITSRAPASTYSRGLSKSIILLEQHSSSMSATDSHDIPVADELSLVDESNHRSRSMHVSAPRKISSNKARR
jgi:hypothetical protein